MHSIYILVTRAPWENSGHLNREPEDEETRYTHNNYPGEEDVARDSLVVCPYGQSVEHSVLRDAIDHFNDKQGNNEFDDLADYDLSFAM